MKDFALALIPNERSSANGKVCRRVVLSVHGEQRLVEQVTLDSRRSVADAAERWAEDFGIDRACVQDHLRKLAIGVLGDAVERDRKRREQGDRPGVRVSELAESFIKSLGPTWHRKARSLYLESVAREVRISQLWTLATNDHVDAVADTHEALEGSSPDYRQRLALLRDAIAMAAARCLRRLPEVEDAAEDRTVDRGQLIHQVAAVLLRSRTYRKEVGALVTLTWHAWACGVEPGSGWRQCFTDPVFAQLDEASTQPAIILSGDLLTAEMRHPSKNRLASDLRSLKLADIGARVRCDAKQWRGWALASQILDSIAGVTESQNVSQASH